MNRIADLGYIKMYVDEIRKFLEEGKSLSQEAMDAIRQAYTLMQEAYVEVVFVQKMSFRRSLQPRLTWRMRFFMIWDYEINIHKAFKDHEDIEEQDLLPKEVIDAVVSELNKLPPSVGAKKFIVQLVRNGKKWTVGRFNKWLDKLYDFADEKRIWLGI